MDRRLVPADLIVDDAVVRFHTEMEGRRDEMPNGYCWYEEAMQYYLRRLKTGDGAALPSVAMQSEFDFSPRIHDDPALTKLRQLYERKALNKYDAPVLEPLARDIIAGAGVKEAELAMIRRLVGKYGDPDCVPTMRSPTKLYVE